MKNSRRELQGGFTAVELVVVLLGMGVLVWIVFGPLAARRNAQISQDARLYPGRYLSLNCQFASKGDGMDEAVQLRCNLSNGSSATIEVMYTSGSFMLSRCVSPESMVSSTQRSGFGDRVIKDASLEQVGRSIEIEARGLITLDSRETVNFTLGIPPWVIQEHAEGCYKVCFFPEGDTTSRWFDPADDPRELQVISNPFDIRDGRIVADQE